MIRHLLSAHSFSHKLIVGLLFVLFSSAAVLSSSADQTKELLIGIEPEHNIFYQMQRYRYLSGYLSEQLGVQVNLTIMSRYGEVTSRFKSLRLDGAFLTPYTATMCIDTWNLVPIVNPVNLNGESTSQGYIFVRKDSGIQSIKDMQGKSIVFVDPATMEGYLFPLALLKRYGIADMRNFFNRFSFSGSNASAFFAVLDGRADIGAAKSTVFDKLVLDDPSIQQELVIIAQSHKFPEITLCMRSDIDPDLRTALSTVLLNMDKTPDGEKVLKQFQALRFIEPSMEAFVRVKKMAQEAQAAVAGH
jgi:phosphonate transport system substrate-binding protein